MAEKKIQPKAPAEKKSEKSESPATRVERKTLRARGMRRARGWR
jgi:hypothetical protein